MRSHLRLLANAPRHGRGGTRLGRMSSTAVGASFGACVPGKYRGGVRERRTTGSGWAPVTARALAPAASRARGVSSGCTISTFTTSDRAFARRRDVARGARLVVRAQGEPRWVKDTDNKSVDDPISGALHQSQGLRERLAEVAGNARGAASPLSKDGRASDLKDWDRWQAIFDRVDAEDQILVALEVRRATPLFRRAAVGDCAAGRARPAAPVRAPEPPARARDHIPGVPARLDVPRARSETSPPARVPAPSDASWHPTSTSAPFPSIFHRHPAPVLTTHPTLNPSPVAPPTPRANSSSRSPPRTSPRRPA